MLPPHVFASDFALAFPALAEPAYVCIRVLVRPHPRTRTKQGQNRIFDLARAIAARFIRNSLAMFHLGALEGQEGNA